jgi:hypothetical protein
MMKKLAVLAIIIVFSGCICCGGKDITSIISGGKESTGDSESECEKPYIQVGSECCLDDDDSGVCDSDEEAEDGGEEVTETTQPEEEETEETTTTLEEGAEETTTTMAAQATTTLQSGSSTTLVQSATNTKVYNCVAAAGYDSNDVLYAYSPDCGSRFVSDASMVSIRTGVDITPMNIAVSTENKAIKALECFFGPYSSSNIEFKSCPRLLCPKTGQTKTLSGTASASVSSQMSGFAKACK